MCQYNVIDAKQWICCKPINIALVQDASRIFFFLTYYIFPLIIRILIWLLNRIRCIVCTNCTSLQPQITLSTVYYPEFLSRLRVNRIFSVFMNTFSIKRHVCFFVRHIKSPILNTDLQPLLTTTRAFVVGHGLFIIVRVKFKKNNFYIFFFTIQKNKKFYEINNILLLLHKQTNVFVPFVLFSRLLKKKKKKYRCLKMRTFRECKYDFSKIIEVRSVNYFIFLRLNINK